ncbi:MAG: pyridoxal-dependent decarboxylase [Bacteroidia bacterium]
MNKLLEIDLNELSNLLEQVKKQGNDYLKNINGRPTSTKLLVSEEESLNNEGLGGAKTLKLFNERFEPIMVASSGPRFWGYVTGGTTPAAIMGDWLATVYDQNTQGTNQQGDISAIIEMETISLLLDLFELPKKFLGGFVTGATMSNFTCMAVARQWLGKMVNKDFAKDGISEKINILTATPHSSVIKSLSLLGIGSNNIINVKTIEGNREAISIVDLKAKINELDQQPFILITSGGTVNTVDFDDFTAIKELRKKYNFWWHIDAAFGGCAACSPTHKHLLKDWEHADSITIDCHKWLNVPYENAVFFVKEEHKSLQIQTFQNSNAPYIGNASDNFNYLHFLPENSRRLKALPAWFTLKAYGKEGYKSIVENCIALAQLFGKKIEESIHFELLAPILLNNLCFTLRGEENQKRVEEFLITLNNTGIVFMTPTFYNNKKGIRASFVNWRTKPNDINIAFEEMKKIIIILNIK